MNNVDRLSFGSFNPDCRTAKFNSQSNFLAIQGYSNFVCTYIQTNLTTELNQSSLKTCPEAAWYGAFTWGGESTWLDAQYSAVQWSPLTSCSLAVKGEVNQFSVGLANVPQSWQTKRLVDGTYQTELTIGQSVRWSDIVGTYNCTVENDRGESSETVVVSGET